MSRVNPMTERAAKAIYWNFIMGGPREQRRDDHGNPRFLFDGSPDYESAEECLDRRWRGLSDLARARWRAEASAALEAA